MPLCTFLRTKRHFWKICGQLAETGYRVILMSMRKLLATLMMLVMLTPSLACAMPVCDQSALREVASTPTTKTSAPPCADHTGDHNDQKPESGKTLNLLKDCMGVDLQVADGVSLHQPDLQAAPLFIMAAHHDVPVIGPDARADGIRGPPPDWPAIRALQPALIFSTQRFRI